MQAGWFAHCPPSLASFEVGVISSPLLRRPVVTLVLVITCTLPRYSRMVLQTPPPGSQFASLDDTIIDAGRFPGVFPKHKFEIVQHLQGLGHLCAMSGNSANDVTALSCANVGIAVEGATDAAHGVANIVLMGHSLHLLASPLQTCLAGI